MCSTRGTSCSLVKHVYISHSNGHAETHTTHAQVLNHGAMTMCFVGAHFDAGRSKVEKRNDNFAKISDLLSFDSNAADGDENESSQEYRQTARGGTTRQRTSSSISSSNGFGVNDHDVVFWFGDLNYRISKTLSDDQVRDMIRKGRLKGLAKFDQLNIERRKGNVFQGYQEGELKFVPTYRFDLNTLTYDNERDPAWCDRVLWRIQDDNRFSVQRREYDLVRFPLSDHEPVRARFGVKMHHRVERFETEKSPVSEMIESKRTRTMNRLMRKRRATMQDVYADTNLVQISRRKTLLKQGYLYTDHGNNKSSSWMQKYFILTRRHMIFKDHVEDDVTLKTRSFPILECEPFKLRWNGQIRVPLSRTVSKMMYVTWYYFTTTTTRMSNAHKTSTSGTLLAFTGQRVNRSQRSRQNYASRLRARTH